jgi:hypothetical protein
VREANHVRPFHAQVVGLGPAALGIAVAADRVGVLPALLSDGLLFLESQRSLLALCCQRFPFVIPSNSTAAEFLEAIAPSGSFARAMTSAPAMALRAAANHTIALQQVGQLMNELTATLAELCRASGRSAIRFSSHVQRVVRGRDGLFTTLSSDGTVFGVSRRLVFATGAIEDFELAQAASGADPSMIVLSSSVLRGELDRVAAAVEAGFNIYVLGSSHSALSAVAVVLAAYRDRLRPGQIGLVCRDVKLYEPPVPDAAERHRFDGLRGEARSQYERIVQGDEPAVELIAPAAFRARPRRALYISAIGYTCRAVEVHDEQAGPLPLWTDVKGLRVGDDCTVLDLGGVPIPNLYALGTGHARRDSDGAARVGINVFHGEDGLEIVRSLLRRDEPHQVATTALPSAL